MIKITHRQLKDPRFLEVVQKIYQSKMAFRSAKRILDIIKELEKELLALGPLFDAVRKEHMESVPEKPGMSTPKEGAEHLKAVEDFLNSVVEVQNPRITAQELFRVELSPSEVELLEGMIDGE